MVAYSQFCMSGDHTVEAAKSAIQNMAKIDSNDDKFVFLFSDANFERYGIRPERLGNLLSSQPSVSAHAFFIASFWDEAEYIISKFVLFYLFFYYFISNEFLVFQKVKDMLH